MARFLLTIGGHTLDETKSMIEMATSICISCMDRLIGTDALIWKRANASGQEGVAMTRAWGVWRMLRL